MSAVNVASSSSTVLSFFPSVNPSLIVALGAKAALIRHFEGINLEQRRFGRCLSRRHIPGEQPSRTEPYSRSLTLSATHLLNSIYSVINTMAKPPAFGSKASRRQK
jgi:hypothetical protein